MLRTLQKCTVCLAFASPLAQDAEGSALVVTTEERLALRHDQFLESRRLNLVARNDPFRGPSIAQIIEEYPAPWKTTSYRWHHQITATVFWVGELASQNNPVSNIASSWDPNWMHSFGGIDDPQRRTGYLPSTFVPNENPFYFALPYNDIDASGRHRPEAAEVIPWFWREFKGPSISVCKDRWIAIHHLDRVCYAQWKDVGPFTTDHWQYVFGNERPKENRNSDAGLDVSPAVRDYLGLCGTDRVAWRFVEAGEVAHGPWHTWQQSQLTVGSDPSDSPAQ